MMTSYFRILKIFDNDIVRGNESRRHCLKLICNFMSHRRNMTENNSNQATMGSNSNQNWMRLNLPINNTGAISNQVGNAVSGIMPTIMGHNPHRIVVSRSSSVDANQPQQTPVTQTSTDNVNNDFVLDLNRLQHNPDHAHSHDFLHQGLQIDPRASRILDLMKI
ncbi:unnamed protein product [Mytilus edulis]|uniref:Uncharacterized protein n=1 Tax=Mytilus edulis TaxID=6550 RepID=A0A8S3RG63_MYTED|nr:unnamed protein product [Mytilus edulis]